MDENKVDFEKMTPAERLKYEVAEEIGLADKVRQYGWRSLTAKESGRIGGQAYAFDSDGWMITADRIAEDGHIQNV